VAALCALVLLVAGVAGCGEEEGVADGAAVTVYVEKPVCATTRYEQVVSGSDDVSFEVRFVCLPSPRREELSQGVGGGRQVDLAIAGANARRATEDSTTVGYLQPKDPAVTRFTQPILEGAGIGWIAADDPHNGVARLLSLIDEADPTSVRADVREALGQG
jgi:hypothetical protein